MTLEGGEPPPRPHFTASYDNALLAGDDRYLLLADNQGFFRRLYDAKGDPGSAGTWPAASRVATPPVGGPDRRCRGDAAAFNATGAISG